MSNNVIFALIKKLQVLYITYLLKKGDKQFSLQKSKYYHFKALKFAKKHNLKDDYAAIYLSIAVAYDIHEQYHQALVALNLAERYPVDDMSYLLITPLKLDILFHNDKYQEARDLAICSIQKSDTKIFETYLALSEIYLALGVYHKAIIYAKESLEVAFQEEYIKGIELSYTNLLDIYRQVDDLDKIQYYLDEIEEIGLFENSAILQFMHYNISVTQKQYDKAKMLLPKVEQKMENLEYEHLHIFYSITLELFKKLNDKNGFDNYFNKFLQTNKEKDNHIEKWLAYSQAGDFYKELQENKQAIEYYKKMAYFLEKVRLTSLNRTTIDRIDFFKDKYYYLLEASLFLYKQQEYKLAFYFLESSKSASLRDVISYKTLAIKDSFEIKELL
jgi:tetratricopeptide (TPR) repeat protein